MVEPEIHPVTGEGVHLTLWGPSAAGKTVLLSRLYAEAADDGDWAIYPTEDSRAFVSEMRARMSAANAFPGATSVGAVERIVYRFRHRESGVETLMVMEDRAGKDYEDLEEDVRQRLATAAGLVLLFDPRRSPAAFEREVWDTLESVHVASGRGGRKDERPIAVCLSKADLLVRSPSDLRRALAEPDAFVRERVGGSALRALDRFCDRYRLFPVSATGVRLRHGVIEPLVFYDEDLRPRVCPEEKAPFNLMAPFSWLLDQVLGSATEVAS
jgi:hypothetical protein